MGSFTLRPERNCHETGIQPLFRRCVIESSVLMLGTASVCGPISRESNTLLEILTLCSLQLSYPPPPAVAGQQYEVCDMTSPAVIGDWA